MTNVLLAAHPTVGHTNALRAIGKQLIADGHSVAMAVVSSHALASPMLPAHLHGTLGLAQQLARDGIRLAPLDFSPRMLWQAAQIPLRRDMALLDAEVRLFTAGIERHAMNVAIHAAHMSADIVVGDYLMPAAMIGAQIAHVPYVALYHSAMPFPKMLDSPFGCGLVRMPSDGSVWRQRDHPLKRLGDMMDRMVHSAARNVGLRLSLPSLLTQPISDTLNLLTTAPEIEPGMPSLQPLVQMVGPCVPAPDADDAAHPALRLPDRGVPRVFLSLGRAFGHSAGTFDLILEGLAALDVQVVVDAGSSSKQLQRWQSAKVHIFQHVPRAALLQQVDVAITYGGNNTVQEALAAGCPMVVIPLGSEQDVNARRVEQLGAGVACQPAQLSPDGIRSAVQAALAPEKAAQARALCGQLQRYGGTRAAADAIVAASQPWANAVGYPVF